MDKGSEQGGEGLAGKDERQQAVVDESLVAMFLQMSVEERLAANDNAVNTVKELRDGYRRARNRTS